LLCAVLFLRLSRLSLLRLLRAARGLLRLWLPVRPWRVRLLWAARRLRLSALLAPSALLSRVVTRSRPGRIGVRWTMKKPGGATRHRAFKTPPLKLLLPPASENAEHDRADKGKGDIRGDHTQPVGHGHG